MVFTFSSGFFKSEFSIFTFCISFSNAGNYQVAEWDMNIFNSYLNFFIFQNFHSVSKICKKMNLFTVTVFTACQSLNTVIL